MEKTILDKSMSGLDGGAVRLYTEICPAITAREYKEPRLVIEYERNKSKVSWEYIPNK